MRKHTEHEDTYIHTYTVIRRRRRPRGCVASQDVLLRRTGFGTARSAVGVNALPLGVTTEVEAIIEITP